MVIRFSKRRARQASLMTELLVAMTILAGVLVPLGWSLSSERRLARSLYQRALAMEIVDGEWEVLRAGEWSTFAPGRHPYPLRAAAATNLPPGEFLLTVQTNWLRLEWRPSRTHYGGPVIREGGMP